MSEILHVRIPEDLATWLEQKCPARGDASRLVRQLLTAEQMKEAVAPLVPTGGVEFDSGIERLGPPTVEDWKAFREGAGFQTKETSLGRFGITPNEFDAHKAKPKARRKKLADPPGTHRDKGSLQAERRMAIKSGLIPPDSCNRGACTGTINPVKGRCVRCNQTPLKESK